jgi:hypothetical protein
LTIHKVEEEEGGVEEDAKVEVFRLEPTGGTGIEPFLKM